jgi:hypothetical protein
MKLRNDAARRYKARIRAEDPQRLRDQQAALLRGPRREPAKEPGVQPNLASAKPRAGSRGTRRLQGAQERGNAVSEHTMEWKACVECGRGIKEERIPGESERCPWCADVMVMNAREAVAYFPRLVRAIMRLTGLNKAEAALLVAEYVSGPRDTIKIAYKLRNGPQHALQGEKEVQ